MNKKQNNKYINNIMRRYFEGVPNKLFFIDKIIVLPLCVISNIMLFISSIEIFAFFLYAKKNSGLQHAMLIYEGHDYLGFFSVFIYIIMLIIFWFLGVLSKSIENELIVYAFENISKKCFIGKNFISSIKFILSIMLGVVIGSSYE